MHSILNGSLLSIFNNNLNLIVTVRCLNLLAVFIRYCLISFNGIFFTNFKSWITYNDYYTVKLDEKKKISFNTGKYSNGYSLEIK
jgi:hypothetical protein